MRLVRASVARLPGIREPFVVEGFGPGATLLVGPNGIGKSSLCRLVRRALWPERGALAHTEATLSFERDGERWEAEVSAGRVTWRRNGEPSDPPPLPAGQAARAARFGLFDLVAADDAEQDLAEVVRRELAGGFDLQALWARRATLSTHHGRNERKESEKSSKDVRDAESAHRELGRDEVSLADLQAGLREASRARQEAECIDKLLALAEARNERRRLEEQLANLPDVMTRLRGGERERLDELDEELAMKRSSRDGIVRECDGHQRRLAELAHVVDEETLRTLEKHVGAARQARTLMEGESDGAAERETLRTALEELRSVSPEDEFSPGDDLDAWLEKDGAAHRLGRVRQAVARRQAATASGGPPWLLVGGLATALAGLLVAALADYPAMGVVMGLAGLAAIAAAAWRRWGAGPTAADAASGNGGSSNFEDVARRVIEAVATARAQQAKFEEQSGKAKAAFTTIVQAVRDAGLQAPGSLEGAEAWLEISRKAFEERRTLGSRFVDLEEDIAGLDHDIDALTGKRARLLEPLGGEEAVEHLDEWIDQIEAYEQTTSDLRAANTTENNAIKQLGPDAPSEDYGIDVEHLQEERNTKHELAGRFEKLTREVKTIEVRLEQAREATGLTDALARHAQASEALAAARERALNACVAGVVLDHVAHRHARESAPSLVRRAVERLADFTCGLYELLLDEGGLRARDTNTGHVHAPDELSDGTRVQLLLAARLSYLESLEAGARLPVMLDEALATSDEGRFEAVAGAFLGLGRKGRQVIYLGARADEVERWRAAAAARGDPEPTCIDLAAARGRDRAVREPGELRLLRPDVAVPQGSDAAAYAVLLGVPLPDPFAEPGAIHILHALPDRLELVHDVLAGTRIATIGPWQTLRERGLPTIDDEVAACEIDARCTLVADIVELWRIGRSRPVDYAMLADSGAVTETFRDRIESLNRGVGRDGKLLLQALESHEDDRTRGFQAKNREKLREHLCKTGALVDDEPLDESELLARVRDTVLKRAARAPGDASLPGDVVKTLIDHLSVLLGAGLDRLRS